MHLALALILTLSLLIPAVALASKTTPSTPYPGFTQEGEASWYGGQFHGRKTASGERYDKNGLSAAHKTLPLGTLVRVENLENGYSVEVRINDRGPYIKGRIIDLSKGAAIHLGMHSAGKAKVRITVLDRNAETGEPPTIRFM